MAVGRGAAGADPLAAAGVALLLLGEAFLEFPRKVFRSPVFQLGPVFLGRWRWAARRSQFGNQGIQAGEGLIPLKNSPKARS